MLVYCKANDCIYNEKELCKKDKIEIGKVNAYDENSAECLEYCTGD